MDRELVERLARECIMEDWDYHVPGYYRDMNLEGFAALVAEECAKLAEAEVVDGTVSSGDEAYNLALTHASEAIRAKFHP